MIIVCNIVKDDCVFVCVYLEDEESGLNGSEIAGLVIGLVLLCMLIVCCVYKNAYQKEPYKGVETEINVIEGNKTTNKDVEMMTNNGETLPAYADVEGDGTNL